MNSSLQKVLDANYSSSLVDLQAWCSTYERYNKYPCSILNRFSIGFYQIHQGMSWKDDANRSESFASAILHFIMVSERMQLPLEKVMHNNLEKYPSTPFDAEEARDLLCHLSAAQQQLWYGHVVNKSMQRKSRYRKETLITKMARSIVILVAAIHPTERKQAFYDATNILVTLK